MKPFNEHLLWKGALKKTPKKPVTQKKDMILPAYNTLTGTDTGKYSYTHRISESICADYATYSAAYWEGVNRRKDEYRLRHRG